MKGLKEMVYISQVIDGGNAGRELSNHSALLFIPTKTSEKLSKLKANLCNLCLNSRYGHTVHMRFMGKPF